MGSYRIALAGHAGYFVFASIDISEIVSAFVGFGFVCIFGWFVWQVLAAGARRKRSGLSPQEFIQSELRVVAEKRHQDVEEWSVPPELSLPTPRLLQTGNVVLAWMPRAWLLFLVIVFAVITWGTKFYPWASVILLAIGCVIRLFRHRREKNLLTYGQPARAVITHSDKRLHHIEYCDAAGNLFKNAIARSGIQKKDAVTVLYDPQRPRQFTSYPVRRYRIAVPGSF
jgi:hypothetical protein